MSPSSLNPGLRVIIWTLFSWTPSSVFPPISTFSPPVSENKASLLPSNLILQLCPPSSFSGVLLCQSFLLCSVSAPSSSSLRTCSVLSILHPSLDPAPPSQLLSNLAPSPSLNFLKESPYLSLFHFSAHRNLASVHKEFRYMWGSFRNLKWWVADFFHKLSGGEGQVIH